MSVLCRAIARRSVLRNRKGSSNGSDFNDSGYRQDDAMQMDLQLEVTSADMYSTLLLSEQEHDHRRCLAALHTRLAHSQQ